jgi:arylsulfatase A-like enzyme
MIRILLFPVSHLILRLFLMAFLLISGCSKKDDSSKYNVLLVTLDTTRTERLSCYGYKSLTSPILDQLAREGVRFDMAISPAAATPIAHASILTGLNPYQHGVRVIYAACGYELPDTIPTLATILSGAGWQTGAFLSAFPVSEFYGFDRGFDAFDNGMSGEVGDKMHRSGRGRWLWGMEDNQRRSDATTNIAIKWLNQVQGPFFTWIHYWDPHDPKKIPPAEVVSTFMSGISNKKAQRSELYDAEIFYMDSQFGRLLKALKDNGQYENTIIVVIADHGEGLNDGEERHGWYFHRLLYQEQIRVPFIMRLPQGQGPRNCVVQDLVRSIDIFPTIIDILQLDYSGTVEGSSLMGLIHNQPEPPRVAYADRLNLFDLNASLAQKRPLDDLLYCAMDRSWKLIYRPLHEDKCELFNLDNDPLEMINLYDKTSPEVRRLMNALNAFDGYVDEPFGEVPVDSAVYKTLKSLGYVGEKDDSGSVSPMPSPSP